MSGPSDTELVRAMLYKQLPDMAASLASASANLDAMRREIDGLRADHSELKRSRETDNAALRDDINQMREALNNMKVRWSLVLGGGTLAGAIASAVMITLLSRLMGS